MMLRAAATDDLFRSGDVSHVPDLERLDRLERLGRPAARGTPPTVMEQLAPTIARVAGGNISVLILGETGAGKEVLAREIHARSQRAAERLLCLNCATFQESILEAELFGYERGAFHGDVHGKSGLIESADGGTVFLDEVSDLPLPLQAKLLRILESGEVLPVGSSVPRTVDIRFISATHCDLATLCAANRFRRDLYFRLNGVSLTVPPLRARAFEIADLARSFVVEACARARLPVLRLAPEAIALLEGYPWPGNVRELKNLMERAVLLSTGDEISADDLIAELTAGARLSSPPPPASAQRRTPAWSADERARILAALKQCAGNQTRAAKVLGMSRRTLTTRLSQLDLPRPRKR